MGTLGTPAPAPVSGSCVLRAGLPRFPDCSPSISMVSFPSSLLLSPAGTPWSATSSASLRFLQLSAGHSELFSALPEFNFWKTAPGAPASFASVWHSRPSPVFLFHVSFLFSLGSCKSELPDAAFPLYLLPPCLCTPRNDVFLSRPSSIQPYLLREAPLVSPNRK